MKYSVGLVAASAALVSAVPNTPHIHQTREVPMPNPGEITVLEAKYSVSNPDELPAHAPNATAAETEFLNKYQPLSDAAAKAVAPVTQVKFASTGSCSREYPCWSVERGGLASIGDKQEISRNQIAAILDELTKKDKCAFDKTAPELAFSGLRISIDGAVLQVFSPPAELEAEILAGMVFDMYKLQCNDVTTNSIRAVAAKTDDKERPALAMCVYPEGADPVVTGNFCRGLQLDGQHMPDDKEMEPMPMTPVEQEEELTTQIVERGFDSIQGILNIGCGFFDIPILCSE
ncbi:hypothetical protein P154DRAFT_619239 [Amniculicola lignicola CBS 123094]|uniref:Uncharacterized protein n=1 Tax=Amniculicola lignicola CBS 123094 TaxID=1392246 RepID=A0A6A5WKV6_9PLEO|nr:hypothetical protein P154DRAFT_619239 [Amniculicola lignicola CBS 123094]